MMHPNTGGRLDMADLVIIRDGRVKDSGKALPVWFEFMEYHMRISTMDFEMLSSAGENWRKFFEKNVRSRVRKAIVAEYNGQIIGFLLGTIEKRPPVFARSLQAYVDSIGVLDTWKKQGIGTMLLNTFEKWAREMGMPFIMLNVVVENDPAIHLYEKLGYKTVILSQRKLL